MAKKMPDPSSATSVLKAAAALMYMREVKNGETPITAATNSCLKKKRKEEPASTGGIIFDSRAYQA